MLRGDWLAGGGDGESVFWCERKGLIGGRRRVFFVEINRHAIAFFDYFSEPVNLGWEKWKRRGNSMGLILEARGPFFAR